MMGNSGIEEPQAADSTVVRALQLNVPLARRGQRWVETFGCLSHPSKFRVWLLLRATGKMLLVRDWDSWHSSAELDPWHDAICPGSLVTGWNSPHFCGLEARGDPQLGQTCRAPFKQEGAVSML